MSQFPPQQNHNSHIIISGSGQSGYKVASRGSYARLYFSRQIGHESLNMKEI